MSITKSRLQQIIKEEVARATEGYSSSGWGGRGGRYAGGDTTGYRGRYSDTPWYRQGGSGRMSDAEARERAGRGYDEPYEPEGERGPRGGLVHSSITIYTDPVQAGERFNANLGPRLDSAADLFIGKSGYDGMAGKFVIGKNMQTGFNDVGARWVLSKSDGGYTFTTGGTVGNGPTPSAALRDAAEQGFEGSDTVLDQLGGGMPEEMGTLEPLQEARWSKLAGLSETRSRTLKEFSFPWEDDEPKYADTAFARYLENAASSLKAAMISRAGHEDGFDPDYLSVVVGPSNRPGQSGPGRTGESYGDMILRVYFEQGDFPVVKGARGDGVWDSKEELIAAANVALNKAAQSSEHPTVKDAQVIGMGFDPDRPQTYGWQLTLNPPVTAK